MPFSPELSIIVPALNEEENVGALVQEIQSAILDRGIDAELIVVDDGSTDATLARLRELALTRAWVRILHRDKAMGQSAAMHAGIQAARGRFIATLDADLQNDPADLPSMLALVRGENGNSVGAVDMVQGLCARRQDTIIRKFSSWVGRTARKLILGDTIRDTGCTTRVVRAEIAKQFPLQFRGMHRFLPVYAARILHARVVEQPVNHRPRHAGVAKYGMMNRGFTGLMDCFAVAWMIKRHRDSSVTETHPKA